MVLCDFSLSLEIGTTVLALLAIIALVVFLIKRKKLKKYGFDIDECAIGLDGSSIHLICNNEHRQIAYKVWVDINTRTLGVKINLDEDIIRVIHDSFHQSFIDTRDLLKNFPVSKLNSHNDLVDLIIRFLNDVLRPYLTKWGVKYNDWYDKQLALDENRELTPVEIQRKYIKYDELTSDLISINEKMIEFSEALRKIAFNEGDAK